MLHEAQLSKSYWGEAFTCTTYIQNRLPTKAIPSHTTPFEMWHNKKPDLTHIRVFGSRCYAKIPDPLRVKLDGKTEACIFLGYSPVSKGYKVQLLRIGATVVSRDVIFRKEPAAPSQPVQASRSPDARLQEDPHFFLPSGSQLPATPPARVSTREPQHPLSDAPQVPSDQHQRPPSLPVTNPLDDHLSSAAPEPDATDGPSPGLRNFHILLPPAPDSARAQSRLKQSSLPEVPPLLPARPSPRHDVRSLTSLALMHHLGHHKQAPRPDHVADSPVEPQHGTSPVPVRKSSRTNKGVPPPRDPSENYDPSSLRTRNTPSRPSRPKHALITLAAIFMEPTTKTQAMTSSQGHHWKSAIAQELNSQGLNDTWIFWTLPAHPKPIKYLDPLCFSPTSGQSSVSLDPACFLYLRKHLRLNLPGQAPKLRRLLRFRLVDGHAMTSSFAGSLSRVWDRWSGETHCWRRWHERRWMSRVFRALIS
uniref:Retroviral polymerase SH3-like domain-containing protein n=1 Tax=Physcomitrium patens TaxID=3218 RepID=A0A2K1J4X2_PHYPA|nr:hypothetical protein PHYPA_022419 [Physcomitrium patens]